MILPQYTPSATPTAPDMVIPTTNLCATSNDPALCVTLMNYLEAQGEHQKLLTQTVLDQNTSLQNSQNDLQIEIAVFSTTFFMSIFFFVILCLWFYWIGSLLKKAFFN